mgnify:CR=1 FL=1
MLTRFHVLWSILRLKEQKKGFEAIGSRDITTAHCTKILWKIQCTWKYSDHFLIRPRIPHACLSAHVSQIPNYLL